MILFKRYINIKNFIQRYTILHIGKLHIRIHKITDCDKTTLYHNHPFHYISIILKGGYSEKILGDNKIYSHGVFSVICRNNMIYHRIESLKSITTTLFIAYGSILSVFGNV